MKVRLLAADDDLVELTRLIRAAYAVRATSNLRFWATHQSVEDTAERFAQGQGLVLELEQRLVGTLTVRPPQPDSEVEIYRDAATWSLCQFAVSPECQGQGLGRTLHQGAIDYTLSQGGRRLALDTAVPATDLIAMYQRWGYAVVGKVDWRPFTNYESVVMTLELADTKRHEGQV